MTNQIEREIDNISQTMEGIKQILDHVDTLKERIIKKLNAIIPSSRKSVALVNLNLLGLSYGLLSVNKQLLQIYQKVGEVPQADKEKEEKDPMYG
jgi:hypothetical protein